MLKLGKIDTSLWNDFPLGKFLLVALIVFIRTEECHVKPRLSASLRLLGLRWLSRGLALSLGGARLSPWCHLMKQKGEEGVQREKEMRQEGAITNPKP